jgi:hypothetical protein
MQRWYQGQATFTGVNADGRPNQVFYFGYNAAPAGGRLSTGDAGWQNRYESHYQIGGSPYFEFHLPEMTTTAGTMLRLSSTYAVKSTGYAFQQNLLRSASWSDYGMASDAPYAQIYCAPGTSSDGTGGAGALALYKRGTTNEIPRLELFCGTTALSINANGSTTRMSFTGGIMEIQGDDVDKRLDLAYRPKIITNGTMVLNEGSTYATDGVAAAASAKLEVRSTTKGFLLPRMTKTQRDAIASPPDGLAVYQTDNTPGLRVRENGVWVKYTSTAD